MKLFNQPQVEEQGDGQSNGGGKGSGRGAIQLPAIFESPEDSEQSDSDLGDSDPLDTAAGLFQRYNKIDKKGNKTEKSALYESLKKIQSEDEEDSEGDGEEEKEEDNKEPEKKESEQLSDEDLLKAKAVNKDGREISVQPAKLITGLKTRVQTLLSELEEAKKTTVAPEEVETLKTQLTEKDNKIKELQDRIDEEFFENSEGFKQTYSEPLNKSIKSVQSFFKHLAEDKAELASVQELFNEASNFAAAGNKEDFDSVIDKIAENYIDGGTVKKNSFARSSEKYFEQYRDYAQAIETKGEARRKMVESRITENRSKDISSIENDIERHVKKHLVDNKVFVDNLPKEMKVEYEKSVQTVREAAKQGIAQFALTGKMPEILNQLISRGVTYNAVEKQKEIGWAAFRDAVNRNKMAEEKIAELEKKLGKFTKEPSDSTARYANSYNAKNKDTGKRKSIIANILEDEGINV